MRKSITAIICTLLLLLLCSCGKPQDAAASAHALPQASSPIDRAEPTASGSLTPLVLALNTTEGLDTAEYACSDISLAEDSGDLQAARRCGETVLALYRTYDPEPEAFENRILWGDFSLTMPAEDGIHLSHLWADETGLWAVYHQSLLPDTAEQLGHWNWDGNLTDAVPLESITEALPCDILYLDGFGLLLLTDSELLRLTDTFVVQARLPLEGSDSFGQLALAADGTVCCHFGNLLLVLNADTMTVSASYELSRNYAISPGDSQYDLYLSNVNALYGVNFEAQTATELLIWSRANLTEPDFLGLSDGGYLVFYPDSFTLQNTILSLQQRKEQTQRSVLVLATLEDLTESTLEAAIQYFNQHNDRYEVVIRSYYGDLQNQDAQLQQLKLDILSGEQIDILQLDGLDTYSFSARGLLEDLYPWLDQDPEQSRADLSPALLGACEVDGQLFTCATAYTVPTFVGLRGLVGDTPGWSLADFAQVLQGVDTSEVTPIADMSASDFLYFYAFYNLNHFVDMAKGTCDFDCEEFRLLLTLCRDYFPGTAQRGSILEGTAVLQRLQEVPIFQTFGTDLAAYGDADITLVGFPGAGGNGGTIRKDYGNFAMLSTSQNKDGAWEFLKFLWSETYQNQLHSAGCPARISSMDRILQRQVTEFQNMTAAEAQTVRALYLGATAHATFYSAVTDIIVEECQALLAGDKSMDDTIAIIQNRASIYLSEQS